MSTAVLGLISPRLPTHLDLRGMVLASRYNMIVGEAESNVHVLLSGLPASEYITLLDPALEWLLSRLCHKADQSVLQGALSACGHQPPLPFLKSLLWALPPAFVSEHAARLAELIRAGCRESVHSAAAAAQLQQISLQACLIPAVSGSCGDLPGATQLCV